MRERQRERENKLLHYVINKYSCFNYLIHFLNINTKIVFFSFFLFLFFFLDFVVY